MLPFCGPPWLKAMLLKSGRSRSLKWSKSIRLPKSWSATASMPAHDCAFALSIAFAEPLPEEEQVGKWEESRFTKREQFSSASLVGLLSASGGIASEVKTLGALLQRAQWSLGLLFSYGRETEGLKRPFKQAKQTLYSREGYADAG